MEEGVKWIDFEDYKFEKDFKETMRKLFLDDFTYGFSASKIVNGKIIRISPFTEEWNDLLCKNNNVKTCILQPLDLSK